MHYEHDRLVAELRNRDEVAYRVEAELRVKVRGGDDRVARRDNGVAVGRALRGQLDADGAGSAAPVLDNDRLAERGSQPVGDRARGDVVAAAGRERHDPADRLRGPGLRVHGWGSAC